MSLPPNNEAVDNLSGLLHLEVNPRSHEPVYKQITRQVRQLIFDGLLPAGTRLPSMREMSKQLGVSLNTIHAALDGLSAENLIVTRRGGGTFVSEQVTIATGANLRTREEMQSELADLPRMRWDAYAFQSDFFLLPPPAKGPKLIRFSLAHPDPSLYPFDRIKQTVSNMLWTPKEMFFDYGHPQGYLPLIDHLEKEMALSGVPMAEGENDIIITSGFQRALAIILEVLLRPGQKVAVEAPTYSSILNLLLTSRIDYVPIPMDKDGMDTEYLAAVLAQGEVRAVITIPTYHNPTGTTMSHERRLHLLRLAARYRVPIIEDDWGRLTRFDGPATAPLKALDPGNYVIHIGNFSKVFLPGLRIGWITSPSDLAVTLSRAKLGTNEGDSYFLQAFMQEFITRGHFARHVRHCVGEYRRRRDAMCTALERHLPSGCAFTKPAGGFSIWVSLPENIMSLPLLTLAREAGVEFLPACYCMPDRKDSAALRLAFSTASPEDIAAGVERLCKVIADCIADPSLLEQGAQSYKDLQR